MSEGIKGRAALAVVGMGCRFAAAASLAEFWGLLSRGAHGFREIPSDRFSLARYYDGRPGAPGRVITREGGFIEDIRGFDAGLFGISHREAALMDPQHRMLLEVAYMAFEDSGIPRETLAGQRCGVFVGLFTADYRERILKSPGFDFDVYSEIGGTRSSAAGRIAHAFDLRGPAVAVDTACASSLTAISLGAQGIWAGDLDLAIAGGCNVVLEPETSICFSRSGMLSPDSRCKFGDATANGFVRSDGFGLIVLKPLDRALADGDRIYATLQDIRSNNDARQGKGLYMTPSREGQAALLRLVYEGVDRDKVVYVEAHGTGTRAGDPVELGSIHDVISSRRTAVAPLYVGSVKTNIGHTEGAAGVAGFIKCALSLYHREIPASLHLTEPNPDIPWAAARIQIPTEAVPLPREGALLAGVSGFGLSGTNVHALLGTADALEAAGEPREDETPPPGPERLVPLSAATPEALQAMAGALREALSPEEGAAPSLYDYGYSAARRRSHLPLRVALVGASAEELSASLGHLAEGEGLPEVEGPPKVAFVFSGQGGQWQGMGRGLMATEPVFRDALAEIDAHLVPLGGFSALEALTEDAPTWTIDRIQPLVFAVQVALHRLLVAYGVTPDGVMGHSMGEAAAAVGAGALTLEEGVRLICVRSRALKTIAGQGEMAVVGLGLEEAEARLEPFTGRLSVAVSNSHRSTVVAGEPGAMGELLCQLESEGVFCRRVDVDVASHSPQTAPLLPGLVEDLSALAPVEGRCPFHSTVEAGVLEGGALGPDYWARNLRCAVRFGATTRGMLAQGFNVFVEIGPHPVLLTAVSQSADAEEQRCLTVAPMAREEDPRRTFLGALGALYQRGVDLRWDALYPHGRWVTQPSYPFQREPFWFREEDAQQVSIGTRERPDGMPAHPFLPRHLELAASKGGRIWELPLSVKAFPWLKDHRVRGSAVFPGAGYVEVALAICEERFPGRTPCLEELRFEEALAVPARRPVTLQVRMEAEEDGSHALSFYSLDPESGEAQRHASASIRLEEEAASGPRLGERSFLEEVGVDLARRRQNPVHGFALLGLKVPAFAQGDGAACASFTEGLGRIVRRGDHLLVLQRGRYAILLRGVQGDELTFAKARLEAAAQEALAACGLGGEILQAWGVVPELAETSPGAVLEHLFEGREGWGEGAAGPALTPQEADTFYQAMESRGIHYGPAFRILQTLELGEGVALASLKATGTVAEELGSYLFHPALLDASFQAACAPALMGEGEDTFLPVSIRRMRLLGRGGAALRCRAWIRGRRGDEIEMDLVVLDAEGRRVAEIDGFTIRALPKGGAIAVEGASAQWLYHWRWEGSALPEPAPPRAWLVGGDGGGLLWVVGGALATRGHVCVPLGSVGLEEGRCDQLLLIFGGDRGEEDSLGDAVAMVDGALQSLSRFQPNGGGEPPGLWIVTRGAHRVIEGDASPSPAAAQLFALARVIANERPDLRVRILDLPSTWTSEDCDVLVACLSGRAEEEIAVREGRVLVHRLSRLDPARAEPRRLRMPIPGGSPWTLRTRPAGARFTLGVEPSEALKAGPGELILDVEAAALGPNLLLAGASPAGIPVVGRIESVGPGEQTRTVGEGAVGWLLPPADDAGFVLGRKVRLLASLSAPLGGAKTSPSLAAALSAHLPAYLALKRGGGLKAGDWVLIRGAEGSLGWAAVHLAASEGAQVIATTHQMEEVSALRSAGARHVLRERGGALAPAVLDLSGGHGVDVCLLLPGSTPDFGALASAGRMVDLRGVESQTVGVAGGAGLLSYVYLDLAQVAAHGPEVVGQALKALVDQPQGLEVPPGMRLLGVSELESALTREQSQGPVAVALGSEPLFGERSLRASPLYRRDGTYLITGGVGGLGLALARRIALGGGGHLLLLSRRGVEPPEVAEIRALGAEVTVAACDVSDFAGLSAAVRMTLDGGAPPLRGMFHLAAVLADGTLPTQDKARIQAAMEPKVEGALNLHHLSALHPVEHFVMFSSAASVIGSPGQANYAAANAFLDSLAEVRQMRGLPALSVGWGTWGEIGLAAAESNRGDRLSARGLKPMDPGVALDAMELALVETDLPSLAIFDMDWDRWAESMPRYRDAATTQELVGEREVGPQIPFRERFAQVDGEGQLKVILAEMRAVVSDVLRIPAPRLVIDRPLAQLGMDSLMAIELRGRLADALGAEVSTGQLLGSEGLKALAESLRASLASGEGEGATPELPAPLPTRSLDPEIQPDPLAEPGDRTLLTGATGFLGAHLLRALLDEGEDVICLVRARDAAHGQARLRETLESYALEAGIDWGRVTICLGDLGAPRLGLAAGAYETLVLEIGVIIHGGALVNHLLPYSSLEAVNVSGTEEILRLGALSGATVHHVSTLGVLPFTTEGVTLPYDELTPLMDRPEPFFGGYAESKWVAEALAVEAQARGLPVSIYRAGAITGSRAQATNPRGDLIWRAAESVLRAGRYPDVEGDIGLSPVDGVAAAIVALARELPGETFHVFAAEAFPLAGVVSALELLHIPITPLPLGEWMDFLQGAAGRRLPLAPFLEKFEGLDLSALAQGPRVLSAETMSRLSPELVDGLRVDEGLMVTYLKALLREVIAEGIRERDRGPGIAA